jgi:hypothetical protein
MPEISLRTPTLTTPPEISAAAGVPTAQANASARYPLKPFIISLPVVLFSLATSRSGRYMKLALLIK